MRIVAGTLLAGRYQTLGPLGEEGDEATARGALDTLAAQRGDYAEAELDEVLEMGRRAADGALAAAFDAALGTG
jgi:hypothetical protein